MLKLTHPDKIFFPEEKISKQDLLDYYLSVSRFMLPLVKGRAVTMHRFPLGIHKKGFIQKNLPHNFPKELKTALIGKKDLKKVRYLLCDSKQALIYLVNQGCLSIHTTLSQAKNIHYPDRLIFDLDPSTKNLSKVKQAAWDLKSLLEDDFKLKTYIMTTGSRGFHVVVPIKANHLFEQVREFAKKVAMLLVQNNPKDYTLELSKEKRKGKVFIDYLRNGLAQTAVAPYSVRATPKASIAMPIHWVDLKKSSLKPDSFTLKNRKKYLSKNKNPWSNITRCAQDLSRALKKIDQ